jgi:glucokinase
MYLGIDLGGTNLKFGIIDSGAEILYHYSVKTNPENGSDRLVQKIIIHTEGILRQFPEIQSIGIGVPGVVNQGVVRIAPNLPGWKDIELRSILEKALNLPIAMDNDANVAAIAEHEFGAGRKLSNFIYVTLGTGVGGCIVINDKVFQGESGGAGEIGHTIINAFEDEGNDETYRTGTTESYLSRNQIIECAKEQADIYPESILNFLENVDVKDISLAAQDDDPAAKLCLEKTGTLFGKSIASVMNLLDISKVIVGGGISQTNSIFYINAEKSMIYKLLPPLKTRGKIIRAKYLKNAGIIGAALIGKNILKKH